MFNQLSNSNRPITLVTIKEQQLKRQAVWKKDGSNCRKMRLATDFNAFFS